MKAKKILLNFLVAVFFCLMTICGFSACSGSAGGNYDASAGGNYDVSIAVSSVSLNRSSATLEIGDTFELYETIYPSNATNKSVTWSSSNPLVATVSYGTVTAKSTGTATITVETNNGKQATCSVTVKSSDIAVTSVSLNKNELLLTVGDNSTLKATIYPSDATDKSVTWSSSNASIVTVSNGMVTAKSVGTATITVETNNGKQATCSVTVQEKSPFTFAEYGTGYAVTGYTGTDTMVMVPSTYNGKAVVAIGTSSWTLDGFYNNTSIKKVVLPNSVYTIGKSAFQNCYFLETIEMPSVISISDSAFYNCGALKEITIPESCVSLGYNAFYACNIKKLTIENMGNLTDNNSKIYDKMEELTIGGIDVYTCKHSNLKKLVLLDGVTEIAEKGFAGMTSLQSVVLPNSLKTIGYSAFYNCSSLTEMTLPFVGSRAGVTANDTYQYPFGYIFGTSSYTGGTAIEQYYYGSSTSDKTSSTYYIPTSLKKVAITGGNILYGAFRGCSSLTSVVIGDSVTSIGNNAFSGCSGLTSVYITDIAAWCNISFDSGSDNPLYYAKNLYLNNELVTEIVIPNSVTSIGDYAFSNCSSLTEIVIPDSVTSIGDGAFEFCSSLTEIVIPNSVTSIGYDAFYGCYSLQYNKKNWLKYLGNKSNPYVYLAGTTTTEITMATIENSCKVIGDKAFYNCSGLTQFIIPDSVTSIGAYAFYDCNSLTSVIIGDSVTSIGDTAFYNCSSLTSVIIGDSVTSIGDTAFYNCSSLTSIKYRGTSSQWSAIRKGYDWAYNTGSYTITYNYKW